MILLSIPSYAWIGIIGSVILFILFVLPDNLLAKNKAKDKDSNESKQPPETREEAWINSIRGTVAFLKSRPEEYASDEVVPVIGWRKLK